MEKYPHLLSAFIAILWASMGSIYSPLHASEDIPDQYPTSALYSEPIEVISRVWSAIGATAPPTYENSGHNNNPSFIVTGEGVVVINAGG